MLSFLILGFLSTFTYGGVLPNIPAQLSMDWDISGKIVGGQNADIKDAPYQVGLLVGSFLACGGSIISKNVIVTAAHCTRGTSASNWRIRAGSTYSNQDGVVINVDQLKIHEKYNEDLYDFDIALMFLAMNIPLNDLTMKVIALPEQGLDVATGSTAFVTGWGATREGGLPVTILQKIYIPIVEQQICRNSYGSAVITDRMICAGLTDTGGKDACQGDSGGPLAVDGFLIGVTSFGRGCARPQYPGVWARVPALVNWIKDNSEVLIKYLKY